MSELFTLTAGDTVPNLQAVLADSEGDAIDLTDASVQFHLAEPRGGDTIIDEPADVIDATSGLVRYRWHVDDTDEPGRYRAEFEVTYANDDVETFPNDGFHDVVIKP
jgi:hypothetical protein